MRLNNNKQEYHEKIAGLKLITSFASCQPVIIDNIV